MVACGDAHWAAISERGHLFVWGQGAELQLGLGGTGARLVPAPMLLTSLLKEALAVVACGRAHTLVCVVLRVAA